MAFTTTDVIERAAGHLSMRTEGRALAAFDAAELLSYLNDIFQRVNAFTGGNDYRDIEVRDDRTLRLQERALVVATKSVNITLPANPVDGMKVNIVDVNNDFASNPVTVKPNDRQVDGATSDVTLSTNGANVVYYYREDLASWQQLNAVMTLATDIPLPDEFKGHLAAWVASDAWTQFRGGLSMPPWLERRQMYGENCIRARFAPHNTARLDPFFSYDLKRVNDGGYYDDGLGDID